MTRILLLLLLVTNLAAINKPKQKPLSGEINLSKTKINEFSKFSKAHSQIRDGVVWTKGRGTGKYPPAFAFAIKEKDCTITFKYRQLGDGKTLTFFVNGDDSFGGFDHVFRVTFSRNGVRLQEDAHTKNLDEVPERQKKRPADKVSGAYRIYKAERLQKVDLTDNDWHKVEIVFKGENVRVSLDGKLVQSLDRPGFSFEKNELYFMKHGGEKGLELGHFVIKSH